MTLDELRDLARTKGCGVYVSARSQAASEPHIFLKHFGLTLGEFRTVEAAAAWLQGEGRRND